VGSYLTLSGDTLKAAKRLKINFSQACDDCLRKFVRQEKEGH
jgi:hypothetical protein